jgi:hypothetical protein
LKVGSWKLKSAAFNFQVATVHFQLPSFRFQLPTPNFNVALETNPNFQLPSSSFQLPTFNCQLLTLNFLIDAVVNQVFDDAAAPIAITDACDSSADPRVGGEVPECLWESGVGVGGVLDDGRWFAEPITPSALPWATRLLGQAGAIGVWEMLGTGVAARLLEGAQQNIAHMFAVILFPLKGVHFGTC